MSTYNCRGAINGIIVQNNPVNWIDPWGLQSNYDPGDAWVGVREAIEHGKELATGESSEERYYRELREAREAEAAKAAADKCPVIQPNTGHYPYFPIDGSQDVTTGAFANNPPLWGGK